MKNIILILSLFLLFSCKRTDYYYEKDLAPSFGLKDKNNVFNSEVNDTLKIGALINFEYSNFDQQPTVISFYNVAGSDSVIINSSTISVIARSEGNSIIDIISTDAYNKKSFATIYLRIFQNQSPILDYKLTKPGNLSPYELEIDLSKSFDPDSKYGGKILAYKYIIQDDYVLITPLSKINYIFSGPGQKKISMQVQDNDSAWSSEHTEYILF